MIKVLHLIKSLGRGGAEMLLAESLKLHDQEQFEFHYIYFLPWKNQVVKELSDAGGKVTCLNATNNVKILFRSADIIKYVNEHGIQMIHCHMPVTGMLGRYVHRKIKLPVIYTEHNKQERYHWITRSLNRYSFNQQTGVIAVSEDVKYSIDQNIKPSVKVSVVENGINTDSFIRSRFAGRKIRQQYNIPEDAVIIGNVAVFRFQKRLKEWVEVFAEVSKKYPNVYGVLVGQGPFMDEVKTIIQLNGLQGKIVLAGLQSEIKQYYSAIDIFMMSSIYEGLPVALLEAMSMECAVVCTDAGGIKTVIRNQKDGLLVKTDQWKDLSFCLESLLEQPALIKKYGIAARERVVESFSLNRMVGSLEEIYKNTVYSV